MAENPYMLTPEEQLLYAAQDPAHPFIDPQVVSTPIEFALNPQKYGYRNLAEAGSAVLEKAAPYILYNMSPGGVPVTASRNIAADWQNPYMSGLEKGANTLTNLLGVAMMAAPSQMGQAGASALNTIGQKAGAYADELAPIMKNVAKSEVGGIRNPTWFRGTVEGRGHPESRLTPDDLVEGVSVAPTYNEARIYAEESAARRGANPKVVEYEIDMNPIMYDELADLTASWGYESPFDVDPKVLKERLISLGYNAIDHTGVQGLQGYGVRVFEPSQLKTIEVHK